MDLCCKLILRLFFIVNLIIWPWVHASDSLICPSDQVTWEERSKKYCKAPNEYHCVPEISLNKSVESCEPATWIPEGYCAIYNTFIKKISYDRFSRCVGIRGCPQRGYSSNLSFKYQTCQRIIPEKGCYLADPACADFTRRTEQTPNRGCIISWNAEEMPRLALFMTLIVTYINFHDK